MAIFANNLWCYTKFFKKFMLYRDGDKKMAKECYSIINKPLFEEYSDTPVIEKCVITELHLMQGFINHLFWTGTVPILGREYALIWPAKLNLISKEYHAELCKGKPAGRDQGLLSLANASSGIFLVVNSTASYKSIGIDINSDSICLLDANTGFLDVVDIRNQQKIVFNHTRFKGLQGVFQFLKTTSGLKMYFNMPKGVKYGLKNVPRDILDKGNEIFANFVGRPIPGVKSHPYAGLQMAMKLSIKIIQILNGPFSGGISVLDGKMIHGNIINFGNTIEAFGNIAKGGLQKIKT